MLSLDSTNTYASLGALAVRIPTDEADDAGSSRIDLSSGSVASSSAGEIFEYSVKFLNGVPVAIDGNVTITNFDAAIDRIVIKTETLPAGFGKDSLLSTSGVDVTSGIDSTRIDFGVNAGTGRAAKYLQVMIGTVADGGIGPNTLKALDEYVSLHGLNETIEQYQENRQRYYEKLKTFKTFGRGWTRRVNETTQSALKMI